MSFKRTLINIATAIATGTIGMAAMAKPVNDKALASALESMIKNDRTKVCLLVAKIDKEVTRAAVCAQQGQLETRKLNFDTTFEIGSISKVMTSNVLAGLIADHGLSLNDTLQSILPKGTKVPTFKGKKIKLKHIITHSSGLPALPSVMLEQDPIEDIENPYAELSTEDLLSSLGDVNLTQKPGQVFEYSNYATMLLSYGLSHTSGKSFESLLKQYVFDPIGMSNAHTTTKPKTTDLAQGHSPLGQKVSHWDFAYDMHGVGGIRASLNDMIRYTQANLGLLDTPNKKLLTQAHKTVLRPSGEAVGMNWMKTTVGGHKILFHEGGTGGFSSLISINPKQKSGIVILADTALSNLGGLGNIAFALSDSSFPAPKPRLQVTAPQKLVESLVGDYELSFNNMEIKLWNDNGTLFAQSPNQPIIEFRYDSNGDFYPTDVDALLRPKHTSKGASFDWMQGGAVISANKIGATAAAYRLDVNTLQSYVGDYPLVPNFSLKVAVSGDTITVQGTGQSALEVTPVTKDEFSQDEVGAYFIFNRDSDNNVVSLTLKQGGQTLTGTKQ